MFWIDKCPLGLTLSEVLEVQDQIYLQYCVLCILKAVFANLCVILDILAHIWVHSYNPGHLEPSKMI